MKQPTAQHGDGTPPGGKPFVVFLAPAQLEALVLEAEDQDEEPATLARRAIRLYLHGLGGDR